MKSLLSIKNTLIVLECPVPVKWDKINEFICVLEPLIKFTKKIQKEKYFAADFRFDLLACEFDLERLLRKNGKWSPIVNQMLKQLRESQREMREDPFLAAEFMDPRLVNEEAINAQSEVEETRAIVSNPDEVDGLEMCPNLQVSLLQNYLVSVHKKLKFPTVKISPSDQSASDEEEEQDPLAEPSTIQQKIERRMFKTPKKRIKVENSFAARLKEQSKRKRQPMDSDPMAYWKVMGARDPEMAAVAAVVLAFPMSQTTNQSLAAFTEGRNGYSEATLNEIMIVKSNL